MAAAAQVMQLRSELDTALPQANAAQQQHAATQQLLQQCERQLQDVAAVLRAQVSGQQQLIAILQEELNCIT
jgi:hypothetical protein